MQAQANLYPPTVMVGHTSRPGVKHQRQPQAHAAMARPEARGNTIIPQYQKVRLEARGNTIIPQYDNTAPAACVTLTVTQ